MDLFLSIWNQQKSEDLESDLSSESWEKYFKTYKILNQQFNHGFLDFPECENSSSRGKGCNKLSKEFKLMEEYKKLFKSCDFDEALETCKHAPGIKLKPNFPRLSVMNKEQHAIYLDISKRLLMNQNTFSLSRKKNILKLFELLDEKVKKERVVFSKFVEQEWNINQEKFNSLNSRLNAFVNTIWKLRLGCVKFYPRMYERQKTIPLTYQGNKELIKMLPMTKPLMSVGKDIEYSPLSLKKQILINTRHQKLCEMFPPYRNGNESLHTYGPTVSCDKRAEDLAIKYNVDIVITSSVLSLIACNTNSKFGKEWDIPVIVKECHLKGKTGEFKRRIVYVDKALPPRNMSAFDKRNFFYKLASKFRLCSRIYTQTARCTKETSSAHIVDPVTHTKQTDMLEDNNGISKSTIKNCYCTCSSPNVCSKINDSLEDHENESDESDNLVIDCSDDDAMPTFEINKGLVKENRLIRSHNNSSSITLRSGSSYCTSENSSSMSPPRKKRKHLDEAEVNSNNSKPEGSLASSMNCCTCGKQLYYQDAFKKSINRDNLTPSLSCNYENNKNIFSQNLLNSSGGTNFLGSKSFQSDVSPDKKYVYHKWKISADRSRADGGGLNILKSESGMRPLSLLIRSKVDGYKVVNDEKIPVHIFPKLEYQYQYGMEALTTSDLYKQWTTLYFKPKSILSRVRINAFTSEVLLTEEKSLDDLESLNRNMRPSIFATIYSLLLGLMDIGPGSYLLSHRNTMGPFVSLMSETKKEESFDLHKEYELDVEQAENVSNWAWRPIDVNMQTPYQKRTKRIPGMFLPANHTHSPQTNGNRKRKKCI